VTAFRQIDRVVPGSRRGRRHHRHYCACHDALARLAAMT
jgi:hypothetical protein